MKNLRNFLMALVVMVAMAAGTSNAFGGILMSDNLTGDSSEQSACTDRNGDTKIDNESEDTDWGVYILGFFDLDFGKDEPNTDCGVLVYD